MMKKINKILLLCCGLFIAFSCVDDTFKSTETKGNTIRMTLLVKAPKPSIVKAADTSPDALIDFTTLKIHLFGTDGYVGSVKPLSAPSYNNNENAYEVTVDFPKNDATVDLVLVANKPNDFVDPVTGTSKSDFYTNATFIVEGKWDIETKKMPFWGEINGLKLDEYAGTKYKDKLKVDLIRAMARIDFVVNEPKNNEQPNVHKSKIKLKSVYVYRSLNKAILVPGADNFDAKNNLTTAPTIPNGVSFNHDNGSVPEEAITIDKEKPLMFNQIGFSQWKDYSINGMIYLPEQKNGEKPMFIVIGALFGTEDKVSYYRIDLKEKNNAGQLLDIIRNHNYIITINGAVGPGYETPQKAASQGGSNIDVKIEHWDNGINEAYIFGDKFFGINTSDIVFEENSIGQSHPIYYKTNLPDSEFEKMLAFSFEKGNIFSAKLDTEKKSLIVETTTENKGVDILEDNLIIHCVSKEFKVKVRQKPVKTDYYLVCDETKVEGVYQKKVALTDNNYILVTAEADNDLSGKYYEIKTNELDGLSFFASGHFVMVEDKTTGKWRQQIKLVGSGTAVTSMKKVLTIIPNTATYSTCNATVKMAFGQKTIVGFHNEIIYEYGYSTDIGFSKIFREDEGNFGLLPNSVIKVPRLMQKGGPGYDETTMSTFTHLSLLTTSSSSNLKIFKSVIDAKPDIIIFGFYTIFSEEAAKILADYVKSRGTVILMSEYTPSNIEFFKALYVGEGKKLEITSSGVSGAGTCYPFINLPNDPIADGPFGSTNGKEWGEDASETTAVAGLPEEDLIIYSRSIPTNHEKEFYDKGVTICRHKKYNLVFIGDAGFISHIENNAGYTSQTICPFMINRQETGNSKIPEYSNLPLNYPIPKIYGRSGYTNTPVYNSVFFANTLAWALEQAEYNGINSGK